MHITAKHSAPSRVTFNRSSGQGVPAFRDCLTHTVSAPIVRSVTVAVLSRYQAGEYESSPVRVLAICMRQRWQAAAQLFTSAPEKRGKVMMLGIGLSTSQWEYLTEKLFLANLWMQVAYLFVVLPLLLASKRRLLAADLPTVSEAGWAPFRDRRLLVGSISIVLAVLVQALWVAALWSADAEQNSACATYGENTGECGGLGSLVSSLLLVVLAAGALAFSATLQTAALSLVRTAWDANEWPQKMSLRERPALTLVRVLRYSSFFCYPSFFVGVLLAGPRNYQSFLVLSLVAFVVSFCVYSHFKRNKRNQAEPQSDSGA